MNLKVTYFKNLDFLRMVSIVIVLFSHWIKECGISVLKPLGAYGVYGVNLFFVISGFLITRNLIIYSYNNNIKSVLIHFFKNRILRLFPAYYLLLIFLFLSQFLFHFWVVYDYTDYLWFITYIPNFFFYFNGWPYPSLNHTWSLAVEEQFYLIWPFVILFFRKKIIVVISLLILFGLYFISLFNDIDMAKLFPMGNFSYLAGGALLGIFENKIKISWSIFIIIACSFILSLFSLNYILFDFIVAIIFVFLVNIFCKEMPLFINKFIGFEPFLYIGKISYGIYLYHRFVPHFMFSIFHKMHWQINPYLMFSSLFFITFFLAHFSYKYYESYFLKMKKYI